MTIKKNSEQPMLRRNNDERGSIWKKFAVVVVLVFIGFMIYKHYKNSSEVPAVGPTSTPTLTAIQKQDVKPTRTIAGTLSRVAKIASTESVTTTSFTDDSDLECKFVNDGFSDTPVKPGDDSNSMEYHRKAYVRWGYMELQGKSVYVDVCIHDSL